MDDALVITESPSRVMQLGVVSGDDGRTFRTMSADVDAGDGPSEWRAHASGAISFADIPDHGARADVAAIRARCPVEISPARLYDAVAERSGFIVYRKVF